MPNKLTDGTDVVKALTPELQELIVRTVISEHEEVKLAKMVYGEDRQNSLMERSGPIWCAFNRSDAWDMPISQVVTHGAFHGYFPEQKCPEWAIWLVRDVATRYALEKMGYENVGRTLPPEYLYFAGRGGHNHFRDKYRGGVYWLWDCEDPYCDIHIWGLLDDYT